MHAKLYANDVPIVLIGTKKDLRSDSDTLTNLAKLNQKPASYEDGEKLAKEIGALRYFDTSAMWNETTLDQGPGAGSGASAGAGVFVTFARCWCFSRCGVFSFSGAGAF
jgi:GTPase SAR1 family protein